MFATPCRPSIRPASAGLNLLPSHFVCGSPGPAFQQYWLNSTSAQHPTPLQRTTCPSPLGANRSGDHEKQQELTPQLEQAAREPYLEVGSIITTHGVRGEVKVQALTDFPEERLLTPGVR